MAQQKCGPVILSENQADNFLLVRKLHLPTVVIFAILVRASFSQETGHQRMAFSLSQQFKNEPRYSEPALLR